ncbi:MAG TPA: hypothetical protein VFC72_07320 [Corynebacterium sp.]|nr:hypothetical protein [Corynebacterium sp.]
MPERFPEQGPQWITLQSLLQGIPLPGGDRPASLGDLPLAREKGGAVRVLREGLEPETVEQILQEPDLKVILIDPEDVSAVLPAAGSALLRSRVVFPDPGQAQVWLEICGVTQAELQVWETFLVTMRRGPKGWTVEGEPLQLAT